MNAHSSTLCLHSNETQQTVERSNTLPEEDLSSAMVGSVVEAGKLRIRLISAARVVDQIRARKCPLVLVDSSEDETSDLTGWLNTLALPVPDSNSEPWGFAKHVRQYLWSISCLLAMAAVFAGIAGLCSLYFGVVLPFELL